MAHDIIEVRDKLLTKISDYQDKIILIQKLAIKYSEQMNTLRHQWYFKDDRIDVELLSEDVDELVEKIDDIANRDENDLEDE